MLTSDIIYFQKMSKKAPTFMDEMNCKKYINVKGYREHGKSCG